jgi:hypothetical protein
MLQKQKGIKQRTPAYTNPGQLSVYRDIGYASSAGRFRFRLPFRESAPVGAENILLFNSAGAYSGGRLRRIGPGSRSQKVYRNDFLILVSPTGADSQNRSRKLNLPALYAHPHA